MEIGCADCQEQRGLRRFSRRGLVRVRTALALAVLVHHLLGVHRSSSQKRNAKETQPAREPIAA